MAQVLRTIVTPDGMIRPARMFMCVQLAIREFEVDAMTEEQVAQELLRKVSAIVFKARLVANQTGPDHPLWGAIYDAEDWIAGRDTKQPIEVIIDTLRKGGLS